MEQILVRNLPPGTKATLRVRGKYLQVERWSASKPLSALFTSALSIAEIELEVAAKERIDPEQGLIL